MQRNNFPASLLLWVSIILEVFDAFWLSVYWVAQIDNPPLRQTLAEMICNGIASVTGPQGHHHGRL